MHHQAIAEGGEYVMVPKVALCSGRRWEVNGVLLNTLLNQVSASPQCDGVCFAVPYKLQAMYVCMYRSLCLPTHP